MAAALWWVGSLGHTEQAEGVRFSPQHRMRPQLHHTSTRFWMPHVVPPISCGPEEGILGSWSPKWKWAGPGVCNGSLGRSGGPGYILTCYHGNGSGSVAAGRGGCSSPKMLTKGRGKGARLRQGWPWGAAGTPQPGRAKTLSETPVKTGGVGMEQLPQTKPHTAATSSPHSPATPAKDSPDSGQHHSAH